MRPVDELALMHQQNVLLCVAVLCLCGCGPVLCVNGDQFGHSAVLLLSTLYPHRTPNWKKRSFVTALR